MSADKTVIFITGANSGIGYETVVALATTSAEYHVIIGARSVKKGKAAHSKIQEENGQAVKASISVVEIDITKPETIVAAKEKIEAEFGKLDVLINNAGIIAYEEQDVIKATRQSFEVNVLGSMLVTDTLEPLLKKSTKPYVIYVSSEQGSISLRLDPDFKFRQLRGESYRISKAALNMLAACHRYNFAEWENKGRVVAFNPGWCVTNLTGAKGREMREKMGARDAKEPARALLDIVTGKRDEDIEKSGLIDVDGGVLPW
ncbi:putative short chain dehydrogenase/reductase [Poronia punctata]|nr:putative short chain dehydrogenase/reductase [Poronia punctata]